MIGKVKERGPHWGHAGVAEPMKGSGKCTSQEAGHCGCPTVHLPPSSHFSLSASSPVPGLAGTQSSRTDCRRTHRVEASIAVMRSDLSVQMRKLVQSTQ